LNQALWREIVLKLKMGLEAYLIHFKFYRQKKKEIVEGFTEKKTRGSTYI
jgi:hypothetical protein